jgi:hypothetical protein
MHVRALRLLTLLEKREKKIRLVGWTVYELCWWLALPTLGFASLLLKTNGHGRCSSASFVLQ